MVRLFSCFVSRTMVGTLVALVVERKGLLKFYGENGGYLRGFSCRYV
jgi:hypothetical protein